jgi:hypothetical protein
VLEEEMDSEGTKSEEGGEGDVECSKRFKGPKRFKGNLQQTLFNRS